MQKNTTRMWLDINIFIPARINGFSTKYDTGTQLLSTIINNEGSEFFLKETD